MRKSYPDGLVLSRDLPQTGSHNEHSRRKSGWARAFCILSITILVVGFLPIASTAQTASPWQGTVKGSVTFSSSNNGITYSFTSSTDLSFEFTIDQSATISGSGNGTFQLSIQVTGAPLSCQSLNVNEVFSVSGTADLTAQTAKLTFTVTQSDAPNTYTCTAAGTPFAAQVPAGAFTLGGEYDVGLKAGYSAQVAPPPPSQGSYTITLNPGGGGPTVCDPPILGYETWSNVCDPQNYLLRVNGFTINGGASCTGSCYAFEQDPVALNYEACYPEAGLGTIVGLELYGTFGGIRVEVTVTSPSGGSVLLTSGSDPASTCLPSSVGVYGVGAAIGPLTPEPGIWKVSVKGTAVVPSGHDYIPWKDGKTYTSKTWMLTPSGDSELTLIVLPAGSSTSPLQVVTPSGGIITAVARGTIDLSSVGVLQATSNADGSTSLNFQITGPSGTDGDEWIQVSKTVAPAGFTPVVLVNGQIATFQEFLQDSNNFYIHFQAHFSTDNIEILFSSSIPPPPPPPPWGDVLGYIILAIIPILVVTAVAVPVRRARRKKGHKENIVAGFPIQNAVQVTPPAPPTRVGLRCPSCNKFVSAEDVYCESCGTRLGLEKTCQSCGSKNLSDAMYCSSCGKVI